MTDNLKTLIVLHSALHAKAQCEIIGFTYCTMKDLNYLIILSKFTIKKLVTNLCINMVAKLVLLI